jgi:16S rRNA G1207 methylase RsmC
MNTEYTSPLRNPSDRVLLDFADRILGPSVLLVMQSGTRLAPALITACTNVSWDIFTFEHFLLTSLLNQMADTEKELPDAEVELHCAPNLPEGEFDSIVIPTLSRSAAELTRDILQDASERVKPNGRVIVSTDNPKDSWLQKQLQSIFGRVTVEKHHDGVCYIARRRPTASKRKDFHAEYAFRDGERLILCSSRPGVFSHRKVDGGARALIRSLGHLPSDFVPNNIVEMGSGCGAVATASALRYPKSRVLAVDSNVRAVEATQTTAQRNGVTDLQVMLSCNGIIPDEGQWDLYITNPPYYSDYRISELFLQSALENLRHGGRLHLVTRLTDWHVERISELFTDVQVEKISEYDVIMATQGQA